MELADIKRKPEWLRVKPFAGDKYNETSQLLAEHGLDTICRAANCPNRGECFTHGTATFLILGPYCTRSCRFCDVLTGKPKPVDPEEPARVAKASKLMDLKHVVVTSVNRDDLPDGGATQFAKTIEAIREVLPDSTVEVLTPDFRSAPDGLRIVMEARPDVFNHNVETVPRLYRKVRPGAVYQRSLDLLASARSEYGALTKSGLMVGLGESEAELHKVFGDLAAHGVTIATIGQYLQPSKDHLPVVRYVRPEEFTALEERARMAGIKTIYSGPLVRSSYHAGEVLANMG